MKKSGLAVFLKENAHPLCMYDTIALLAKYWRAAGKVYHRVIMPAAMIHLYKNTLLVVESNQNLVAFRSILLITLMFTFSKLFQRQENPA